MAIFTILILSIHEDGMFLHLSVSSLISLSSGLQFFFYLYLLCQLYSQVFYSLCSNCEWQFVVDLALFKSVIVVQNACGFCTLILYPETLVKLLISFRRFWAETMGSSKYTIMSSANRDNLTSSFPSIIEYPLFLFLA